MSKVNTTNSNPPELSKKTCIHCKKKVATSLDCIKCGSSYHPSCAAQAKVLNPENKVCCCLKSKKSVVSEQENSSKDNNMDEKRIKNVLKDLLNEHLTPFKKTVQSDLVEIKKSLQFVSDGFDEQKETINKLLDEIKSLRNQNQKLEKRVQELEDRVNFSEQQEKEKNLIISGIPKQTDSQTDEPKKVVKKVLSAIQAGVNEDEILETYYVSKRENAPIVIKFKNKVSKQKVQIRIKQLKGIKVNECGLVGENKNIYFNDDLTKKNQYLFKIAREHKQNHKCKSAYVLNGRIYLRKDDNTEPIRVRNESDLMHI